MYKSKVHPLMNIKNLFLIFILLTLTFHFISKKNTVKEAESLSAITPATVNPTAIAIPEPVLIRPVKTLFNVSMELDLLKRPNQKHAHFYSQEFKKSAISMEELNKIGSHYGLPEKVLFFQNHLESSGGCQSTPNHKGAVGCFQFLYNTAKEFSLTTDLYDYRNRLHASADTAARYMKWLSFFMYGEDADLSDWEQLRYVLAAYNAGFAVVTKSGRPRIPNFYETVKYVNAIEDLVKGTAVVVEWGDTLSKLSARTGYDISIIKKGNPHIIGDLELKAGDIVSLPNEDGMSKLIMKSGMSLLTIQNKTGVTVSELIAANDLKDSNAIRTAEILYIPTE
jgi:LysM repeat protein